MAALNMKDRRITLAKIHRAATDAVRTLAVVSTLIEQGKFEYKPVARLQKCKQYWQKPKIWRAYGLKACIITSDFSMLPSRVRRPRALAACFKGYGP